jgi:hypothetical protein
VRLILTVVFVGALIIVTSAFIMIKHKSECEARGGVYVIAYSGWMCFDKKALR